jgi:hypothetical protein
MSKIPASAVNYGLFSFLPSLIEVSRAGRCGVPLEMTAGNYSNVGHRGPVYKGLGAMNPCDNLKNTGVFEKRWTGFETAIT